jgi:hypothetical protein
VTSGRITVVNQLCLGPLEEGEGEFRELSDDQAICNAGWTIERIPEDAARIGPATPALCEQILDHRPHPEQGLSRCLGIVRLARPVIILATGPRTAMPPKEIAHVGVP